jgi:hypothetical protein
MVANGGPGNAIHAIKTVIVPTSPQQAQVESFAGRRIDLMKSKPGVDLAAKLETMALDVCVCQAGVVINALVSDHARLLMVLRWMHRQPSLQIKVVI